MLQTKKIGIKLAYFYEKYAKLFLNHDSSEAKKILQKGIEIGAEPQARLSRILNQLSANKTKEAKRISETRCSYYLSTSYKWICAAKLHNRSDLGQGCGIYYEGEEDAFHYDCFIYEKEQAKKDPGYILRTKQSKQKVENQPRKRLIW